MNGNESSTSIGRIVAGSLIPADVVDKYRYAQDLSQGCRPDRDETLAAIGRFCWT